MAYRNLSGQAVAAIVSLMLVAALLWHSFIPLTTDVSYFIAACGRVLDGARPYTDILETNPPLAFWLTLPAIWIARLAGLEPHYAFAAYFCSLIGLSLLLTYRVCKSAGQESGKTSLLILAAAAVLALAPAESFGQREHFAALLMFPYVTAALQLAEGRQAGRGILIVAGLCAGIGLSFKPYLLAIPAMVEVCLLLLKRDWRSLFRLELVAMAVPVAVYPVIAWWFAPEYFTRIVPLAMLTYGAYDVPLVILLGQPAATKFLGVFGGTAYLMWRDGPKFRSGFVWMSAALGSYIGYLAQSKGFPYHLLPGAMFAQMALLLFLAQSSLVLVRVLAAVFIGFIVISGQWKFAGDQNKLLAFMDRMLEGHAPKRMMALTHQIGIMFPYVDTRKIGWASSFPSLWMLPSVSRKMIPAEQQDEVVALAADIVVRDIVTLKPDYVIVDQTSYSMTTGMQKMNYIAMLSRSPAFVQAWSRYRLVKTYADYELWRTSN